MIRDLMPFAATPAAANIPQASQIMGPLPSHRFAMLAGDDRSRL
ncbi:hypothetical protein [Blastochloris viridis]|uniref:Uncharacterized protein n=1 Tax=Blastochloris viridis TaxID=1079 RepID=A0A0H5B7Z6_BLAVI|nr:hypothetical protein [Blastochloris viridis]ALK08421.1 hypothetical protein BVIR_626 [Blastochloris viridis]BAR98302.1 hypothetical protein BV133_709 [Blastochloris viridis]CUU41083.1 hypothetical protein BVIRIDIS_00700 [Blastochloris viridis]